MLHGQRERQVACDAYSLYNVSTAAALVMSMAATGVLEKRQLAFLAKELQSCPWIRLRTPIRVAAAKDRTAAHYYDYCAL